MMDCDTTVIQMGTRRSRRRPAFVSMHVENEACGAMKLRQRKITSMTPVSTDTSLDGKFTTPENRTHNLDDSGYPPSPSISSDPDWYLRPKRGSYEKYTKKYAGVEEVSGPAISKRMKNIFSGSRPSYVEYRSPRWFLKTEAILGAIVFVIFISSIMFSILISARFFESSQHQLNGKYRSLQFAKQQYKSPEVEVSLSPTAKLNQERINVAEHIPRDEDPVIPAPQGATKTPTKKRTKNNNPLLKSYKKAKMSKRKVQENVIPDSIDNDYDDPTGFRGKETTNANIENDYDTDPQFRGGILPKVEVKSSTKIVTELLRN